MYLSVLKQIVKKTTVYMTFLSFIAIYVVTYEYFYTIHGVYAMENFIHSFSVLSDNQITIYNSNINISQTL